MADVQGCGGAWWENVGGGSAANATGSASVATPGDDAAARGPDMISGRQMYYDSLAFLEDQYFNVNAGTPRASSGARMRILIELAIS